MSFTSNVYAEQGRRLLNDTKEIVPKNTKLAYTTFQEEFKGFCDSRHGHEQFPHCVTEEKLFGFMWYQAYRQKQSNKSKHNIFDTADYEGVVAAHPPSRTSQFTDNEAQMSNFPGFQSWEKCSIMQLASQQRHESSNNLQKQDFKSDWMDCLKRHVQARAPHLKKARYDEKMDESTIPYRMLEHIKPLETKFWLYQSGTLSQAMVSLRNRLFYLFTLSSLVQGESMWHFCLSDLFGFTYHPRHEPHPYYVLSAKICKGKANPDGKPLYGRIIRHKDVTMCAVGALAFYLLVRFEVTREDREFDFRDNSNWFDVKLMAGARNRNKAVGSKEFATIIRKHLAELGVSSCHAAHFGPAEGPKVLEFEEVEETSVKRLGNWSLDVHDKVYSGKMPLPAMRVANGHAGEKGMHFNPRTMVEPPESIRGMIFPFIENAEKAFRGVPDSEQKTTADAFLAMMKSLRKVVLQDAAVMMILGRSHIMFSHPAFKHPDFVKFKAQMAVAINTTQTDEASGKENTTPHVLLRHFANMESARKHDRAFAEQKFAELGQQINAVDERLTNSMKEGFVQASANMDQLHSNMVTIPYFQGFLAHAASYSYSNNPRIVPPSQDLGYKSHPTSHANSIGILQPTFGTPTPSPTPPNVEVGRNTVASEPKSDGTSKLRSKYQSATDMYQDWYGEGETTNFPKGGIDRLERDCSKRGWRKCYTSSEGKAFSRLKFIVSQIRKHILQLTEVGHNEIEAREMSLNYFDSLMRTRSNCTTLSGLERYLKSIANESNRTG